MPEIDAARCERNRVVVGNLVKLHDAALKEPMHTLELYDAIIALITYMHSADCLRYIMTHHIYRAATLRKFHDFLHVEIDEACAKAREDRDSARLSSLETLRGLCASLYEMIRT
jgi:hypothetical protein